MSFYWIFTDLSLKAVKQKSGWVGGGGRSFIFVWFESDQGVLLSGCGLVYHHEHTHTWLLWQTFCPLNPLQPTEQTFSWMTFHHPADESRLPSVTSSLSLRLFVGGLLSSRLKEAGDIRFVSHFIFPFFFLFFSLIRPWQ